MDGVLVKAINCVQLLIAIRLGITVPILAKDNFVATTVVVSAQGLKIVLAAEVEAMVAEVHPDAVNVPVPRLRQDMTIVSPIVIVVVQGRLVVPLHAEGAGEVNLALAMDNRTLEIVVFKMSADRIKAVINKKVAGGVTVGAGNATVVVPAVGQPVLPLAVMANKPMVVEPPETAVMAPVVPFTHQWFLWENPGEINRVIPLI